MTRQQTGLEIDHLSQSTARRYYRFQVGARSVVTSSVQRLDPLLLCDRPGRLPLLIVAGS